MSSVKELFESKQFDEVISRVNGIESPSTQERSLRAQSYFAKKQWKESLDDFSHVLRTRGPAVPPRVYQKTRKAVALSKLDKISKVEFWKSCSEPISLEMESIMHDIIHDKDSDVYSDFKNIISKIFDDPNLQEKWGAAFNMLVASCRGQHIPREPQLPPRKKILVSGTGWSGSGAIYDYLREFPEIYAVKGESTALQGDGGLRMFIHAKGNREKSIEAAVNFFFRFLLGYAPIQRPMCLKGFRGARKYLVDPKWSTAYAESAQRVVSAIADLLESVDKYEDNKDSRNLRILGNSIADNLIAFPAPMDKVALLDNCIFIENLDLVNYLENSFIICSIRDPRSNYVALKRENLSFHNNLNDYIIKQEDRRNLIHSTLSKFDKLDGKDYLYKTKSCKIKITHFEEFVLSRDFRDNIASELELNLDGQEKFKHFKPWESIRNAQIHQEYEDQSEIELIAEKLSQYCVEATIGKGTAAKEAKQAKGRSAAQPDAVVQRRGFKKSLKSLRFWA